MMCLSWWHCCITLCFIIKFKLAIKSIPQLSQVGFLPFPALPLPQARIDALLDHGSCWGRKCDGKNKQQCQAKSDSVCIWDALCFSSPILPSPPQLLFWKADKLHVKKELQIAFKETCSIGILVETRTQGRTITPRRKKSVAEIKKLIVERLISFLCKVMLPKEGEKHFPSHRRGSGGVVIGFPECSLLSMTQSRHGTHDMYVCVYVYIYVSASVCQHLLQLVRVKIESGRNNFGKLAKMAGFLCFLPLYLFV